MNSQSGKCVIENIFWILLFSAALQNNFLYWKVVVGTTKYYYKLLHNNQILVHFPVNLEVRLQFLFVLQNAGPIAFCSTTAPKLLQYHFLLLDVLLLQAEPLLRCTMQPEFNSLPLCAWKHTPALVCVPLEYHSLLQSKTPVQVRAEKYCSRSNS